MPTPETYRRQAKALRKSVIAQDPEALRRVRAVLPQAAEIRHADALHVIAREAGYASWPRLKFAHDASTMDREAKALRLAAALHFGQHWMVEALLSEAPDLGRDSFGLACALYDIEHVRSVLARDPQIALRSISDRSPLIWLCFSQHLHGGGSESDMMAVAEALLAAGADVNDFYNYDNDPKSPLSALYGALGHARNLPLARWLLQHGANPNDGESLYHATELGHTQGLQMLFDHGADPAGTNVLPRALDFNDAAMVRLLLEAGADPNEGITPPPSGEAPFVIPALFQSVRRMCDGEIVGMLLAVGADPSKRYQGVTPYAMARVFGNAEAARRIADAGGDTALTEDERLLAAAVDGPVPEGHYLNVEQLPDAYRDLLRNIMHLPGKRGHVERLVAIGAEWDRPDPMGLTPVQIAGWEGLPEMVQYFLRLRPDLSHVNGYGGTLLGTIIHGSENCPARAERDHVACARLALEEGVALPSRAITFAGDPEMAGFLAEWADGHPGQVVEA